MESLEGYKIEVLNGRNINTEEKYYGEFSYNNSVKEDYNELQQLA